MSAAELQPPLAACFSAIPTAAYRPASGICRRRKWTTERLRIDSSGNVGIGTTTPAATLDVSGGAIFKNPILYPPIAMVSNPTNTAINLLTISNLDISKYNNHFTVYLFMRTSNIANYALYFYINGDFTPSNYYSACSQDCGSPAKNNNPMFITTGSGVTINETFYIFDVYWSKLTNNHIVSGQGGFHSGSQSAASGIQIYQAAIWHNGTDNITSISIGSSTSTIIGTAYMYVYQ